jgi:AraC-like DNA-binding protein
MKYLLEKYDCDIGNDSIWIHANPSAVARSTFFYVQEAGVFKCHSKYYTERENLNSFLALLTISGQGTLVYQGQRYSLPAGHAVFIDCMEHNFYSTAPSQSWTTCWVHFNGANTRSYYELFQKSAPPVVRIVDSDAFRNIVMEIIRRHHDFSAETELMCSKLIMELMTMLLQSAPSKQFHITAIPGYIQAVVSHIDKNYAENLSLDELADLYAVSKYHLARVFKRYIGIPIHEYQIQLRINLSKGMLINSPLSVAEISQSVGFDNVSHFINLFKERVHDTPLTFRKKWQSLEPSEPSDTVSPYERYGGHSAPLTSIPVR